MVSAHRLHEIHEQRHRAGPADERRISTPVEIPQPDGEHISIENSDSPGVAESVGGAGFQIYMALGSPAPSLLQHLQCEECRFRAQ